MSKVEKLKNQPKKQGGARPGAGRKAGGTNESTKLRRASLKEFRRRVSLHADELFNAQYSLARGITFLYRIDEVEVNGKKKRQHIRVTDPDEIKDALDNIEAGENGTGDNDYYYITTEKPDNKAIDSLLDRTFGRAVQGVAVQDTTDLAGLLLNLENDYDYSEFEDNTGETPGQKLENAAPVQDKE
jgi:hypothetical protein